MTLSQKAFYFCVVKVLLNKKKGNVFKHFPFSVLRRPDSNERPLGYEPNELPLLHSAIFCGAKVQLIFISTSFLCCFFDEK